MSRLYHVLVYTTAWKLIFWIVSHFSARDYSRIFFKHLQCSQLQWVEHWSEKTSSNCMSMLIRFLEFIWCELGIGQRSWSGWLNAGLSRIKGLYEVGQRQIRFLKICVKCACLWKTVHASEKLRNARSTHLEAAYIEDYTRHYRPRLVNFLHHFSLPWIFKGG